MAYSLVENIQCITQFNSLVASENPILISPDQIVKLKKSFKQGLSAVYDKWVIIKEPFTFKMRAQIVDEIFANMVPFPDQWCSNDYANIKRKGLTTLTWAIISEFNVEKTQFINYSEHLFGIVLRDYNFDRKK